MFCGAAVDTQKHADAKQNVGDALLIETTVALGRRRPLARLSS